MPDTANEPETVAIWDAPTRLFHWALVILVMMNFITAEGEWPDVPVAGRVIPHMTIHIWCGYAVLVLILFRLVWGVIGSATARFSQFVRGPNAVVAYLRGLFRKPAAFIVGHNPAGAVMVVAILTALLVQAITGLYAKDDDDLFGIAVGPLHNTVGEALGKTLTHVHHVGHEIIEILVYIHILANLFYWLVRREDLIASMVTGRRRLPPGETAPVVMFTSSKLAFGTLAAAAVVVWAAITLLRY